VNDGSEISSLKRYFRIAHSTTHPKASSPSIHALVAGIRGRKGLADAGFAVEGGIRPGLSD
jgi:hypothetical protein